MICFFHFLCDLWSYPIYGTARNVCAVILQIYDLYFLYRHR